MTHEELRDGTPKGAASLAGTLAITLSGFQPDLGAVYTILTYGARTGAFDTVTGLDIGNGKNFEVG